MIESTWRRPVAGPLTVRIGDRWMPANCIVVPAGTDALVGQVVMEQLDLVADCATQTTGPVTSRCGVTISTIRLSNSPARRKWRF